MSESRGDLNMAMPLSTASGADPLVDLDEILRFAFAQLGSVEDAEDVAMEVFETVHRLRKRLSRKRDPRTYIFGIARRKIADVLRARYRQKPCAAHAIADSADLSLRRQMIGEALERLPDLQREVLVLKYLHGFSIKEIASIVGKSGEAVNSLLQRARNAFAEHASDLIS